MTIHVFGIRHHGPGSARSLRAALAQLEPDAVLIEGPPEADGVIALAAHPAMKPPVALLVYASEAPERAGFFPMAIFSPEWQALRFAAERGVPARFIDLPQAIALAAKEPEAEGTDVLPALDIDEAGEEERDADREAEETEALIHDPIGELSRAAGYDDRELWWEHQIEQRQDPSGVFEGILEAIGELRRGKPPTSEREARREAFMRKSIRAAEKEGFARIAVVCGAWHGPALASALTDKSSKSDDALLRGLTKTKVEATWIPWTYGRLAYASGYGAGIASPGWYEHLWTARDKAAIHWVVRVAQLLRGAHLDASPASVIETVRLAETLAALRSLPMPGLAELNEAAQSVLCAGEAAPMALVREQIVIGGELGEVPEETPSVPLQRDLAALQKRLRMKPSSEQKAIDLDLREENDRARSQLLHRLALLGITWGTRTNDPRKGQGTFREVWTLHWRPELALAVVEANVFGNTIESAATNKSIQQARAAKALPELTALLDATLIAELHDAVDPVLACIEERSLASDVLRLMEAMPDLVRAARYGNVRETRAAHLGVIAASLFARIVVGLPAGCASLDDDAASAMIAGVRVANDAIALLDRPEMKGDWRSALTDLHAREGVHGLVRGGVCRILVEQGCIDATELERLARLSLSPVLPAESAAVWAEGLLGGSASLLLHHDGLWSALDAWLSAMTAEAFAAQLPLVRRAFASFKPPERRAMGERVRILHGAPAKSESNAIVDVDPARAALVYPVLSALLGVSLDAT